MNIILASASPRRQELLAIITPSFTIEVANVNEEAVFAPTPTQLVQKLAVLKASAIQSADAVIGCDTIVEINGEILGKPKDENHAIEMLNKLSGNTHFVHTGVCIKYDGEMQKFVETTKVTFSKIPQSELQSYVKTKEAYDKAGGYGIQSWAARYITAIDGCFFNVMGLPVARLCQKLRALGLDVK